MFSLTSISSFGFDVGQPIEKIQRRGNFMQDLTNWSHTALITSGGSSSNINNLHVLLSTFAAAFWEILLRASVSIKRQQNEDVCF